jgi:glycosyltransferase involved in cell wall biosynthesis
MAESARRLVERRYDWRTIAADYENDLYDVVRESETRRGDSTSTGPSI